MPHFVTCFRRAALGRNKTTLVQGPPISTTAYTPRTLAKKIAGFASDKKADDILLLDMRKIVNFCDYFVICSGNTDRQVKAIADGIEQGLAELGVRIRLKQGRRDHTWVVLDTGDIVAHVFQKQVRDFYNLEQLWQEAKAISWDSQK